MMCAHAQAAFGSRTSRRCDELSAAANPAIPHHGATFRCALCEAREGSEMGPNPDFPRSRIARCHSGRPRAPSARLLPGRKVLPMSLD